MLTVVRKILTLSVQLLFLSGNSYASGIDYEEVNLEKAVTDSTFILLAEYIGEDKDAYGPHSKYRLKKVIYAVKENVSADLKVWAAHAKAWGMAMAYAEKTGGSLWFSVPAYKGDGRALKPEKGMSYILLLKQLSRETDFIFYAEGALLEESMLSRITLLVDKGKKKPKNE